MQINEATIADIPEMHRVRMAVRENVLSDPARVQHSDYEKLLGGGGQGWVCVIDGEVRGFSVADLEKQNLWALFVEPGFEGRGIGRVLHDHAVDWLFENGAPEVWLTTGPGTRAEQFYYAAGWIHSRVESSGEYRLELRRENWKA